MTTMQRSALRIASYNIRKARGLDQRRDPGRVLDVINALDADVVVLQEADLRLGQRRAALPRDMIETHSDFDVAPLAQTGVSLGWHGNAILLRRGLAAGAASHIALPGLEPRGAVRLDITGAAVALSVIGLHLGLRRRDRQRQLKAISQAIPDDTATLIAGDFNEWSATAGLDALPDSVTVHAPGRSFHARRPVAALDRIAVSEHLRLHDAGVVETGPARRASDHLPIWADIEI